MKTGLLWLVPIIASGISGKVFGQVEKCATNIIHERRLQQDAQYAQLHQQMEEFMSTHTQDKVNGQYRIPVVIHVVYYSTGLGATLQSISDDQIRTAVQRVNERFRAVPGSPGASGTDTDIEFTLAVRDPDGNCTTGITRDDAQTVLSPANYLTYSASGVSAVTSDGLTDEEIHAVNRWDPAEYFNIWLITEFDNNNGGEGVQGYAALAGSHGTDLDGSVMIGHDFVNPSSTTFTHEVGHSFNLYHTFQGDGDGTDCPADAFCGFDSDCVADTPPHKRSQSNCNPAGTNSCTGGSNALFVYNYMDYSSCGDHFTAGQIARMIAAASGIRASFLASNGNDKLVPPAVPSNTEVRASSPSVCLGESVQLFDASTCIPNDYLDAVNQWPDLSFSWSVTNGTETFTSAHQNPVITPTTTGTFNATLTITHATLGTVTTTTNAVFMVVSSAVTACSPTSSNTGNYGNTISNVTFNTINNNTAILDVEGYNNYICDLNTAVFENAVHELSVTINGSGSGTTYLEVDIDWNNDGDFGDAGENSVLSGNATEAQSPEIITGNITIPATAVQNELLRMRVMSELGAAPSTSKQNCSTPYTLGEIEDYGIVVKSLATTPVVSTNPVPATLCQSGDTSFTAAFTNTPTSYIWQVSTDSGGIWTNLTNTAPYSNVATVTLTITGATTAYNGYQYRCEATNASGTGNSNAATLTVNSPVPPTFDAFGPYCSGAAVPALPATSNNGIDGTWSPTTINNTSSGAYVFTAGANECADGPHTIAVTINPAPSVSFGTVPSMCIYSNPVVLTQGSPAGGTYSGTGVSGNQFNPAAAGLGNETLTYSFTNAENCSASATTVVFVDECLGMNEKGKVTVNIYPNPSSGLMKIVSGDEMIIRISVYDYAGRLVVSKTPDSLTAEVDLSDRAAGIYQVTIETGSSVLQKPVFIHN